MRFKDQLQFVGSHIKKNKLRVAMTTLAATMGCAFLIILASVGFGLEKTITDDVLANENVTSIELMSGEQLTDMDIAKIEVIDNVRNVRTITRVLADAQVAVDDRTSSNQVMMTDFEKYAEINDELSQGRFPTAPNEVVVGYHFAQLLLNDADRDAINEKSLQAEAEGSYYDGLEEGYKESILGLTFNMSLAPHTSDVVDGDETSFTVVGVLPPPAYEWAVENHLLVSKENEELFNAMYMSALPENYKSEDMQVFQDELTIFADKADNVEAILEKLRDKGYQVYSVMEQLDEVNLVFGVVKVGLVLVGAVAVLIASIGIFNTMTMAVTERTREIGVMKALGASPKLIKRLFLMESAAIGFIGVALAIVISYIVSYGANMLMPFIVEMAFGQDSADLEGMILSHIPLELTLVAAAISLGIAILSGVRPAKKATQIEVMQALRQEL